MRALAGLIAIAVLATLCARLSLTMGENNASVLHAAWIDFRFFTIWSNTLIGVVCAMLALGCWTPQWLTGASALSITIVATVYHVLLSAGRTLTGLDYLTDLMLHTVVPVAFVALWLFALPKGRLVWRDLLIWAGYPIIYCIYAILRGAVDGVYPYFFLNVADLGALGVAAWIAGLAVLFTALGALMIGASKRLPARA